MILEYHLCRDQGDSAQGYNIIQKLAQKHV